MAVQCHCEAWCYQVGLLYYNQILLHWRTVSWLSPILNTALRTNIIRDQCFQLHYIRMPFCLLWSLIVLHKSPNSSVNFYPSNRPSQKSPLITRQSTTKPIIVQIACKDPSEVYSNIGMTVSSKESKHFHLHFKYKTWKTDQILQTNK